MTPSQTSVPLNRLCFDPEINARVTATNGSIDELVASISAHGLLQPLRVRPGEENGDYLIVVGSRRLTALNILADRGEIPTDDPIPVTICDSDDGAAAEASLAENIIREPMHPVDQFEAFSHRAEGGATPAEIATRFGVAERLVRQRIALGALHPDIRAAWRAGDIGADAAQAFTLARDPMHQKQVYLKLQNSHELHGYRIRAALGAGHDADAALKFIGLAAYRAAGGEVIEDLFGGPSAISDAELAQQLAAKAIDAECKRLVEEDGWSFAEERTKKHWSWQKSEPAQKREPTPEQAARLAAIVELLSLMTDEDDDPLNEAELPSDQRGKIEAAWNAFDPPIRHSDLLDTNALDDEVAAIQAEAARGGFSPRQKKKGGCLVDLTEQGVLQITYGALRPEDPKNAADKAKGKKGDDPDADAGEGDAPPRQDTAAPEPEISATLRLALTDARTLAAANVLRRDAHLALRAIVAAFETRFGSPIKVTSSGHASTERDDEEDIGADGSNAEFGARLRRLQRLPDVAIHQRVASIAACALDMRTNNPDGADALIGALDADEFRREALQAFDPGGYFKGVNAALCHKALDEMGGAKTRPKKKADLAEFCAVEAATRRWLPIELRHPIEIKGPSLAQSMLGAIAAHEGAVVSE